MTLDQSFSIRDACSNDIDDIAKLGALLNTINLPANKFELEQVINLSERSFSLKEPDPAERCFLFALINSSNNVIGVSQIRAQHGTLGSPHSYFQVGIDERYSSTLHKYFRHQTLRLCQNFAGPTEIGSLILSADYRAHKESLGRQLSFVRFLFMAMNRDFFREHVLAELMPPLGANFASALWNAVGHKFTGLDYPTADMISRKNKEFIKSLFPAGDIYLSMLPSPAQEVIGQVGPGSLGAARLLSAIGFRYYYRVDPFDGGPHFEAELDAVTLMKTACQGHCLLKHDLVAPKLGLIGHYDSKRPSGERFKALRAYFAHNAATQEIAISSQHNKIFGSHAHDNLWAIELNPGPF
jgi:arginine N-succinyltransferase